MVVSTCIMAVVAMKVISMLSDYIGDDEEIFEIVGENLDVTVNNIFVDTEKDQVVIITD